jgi:hypothetical protein
MNLSYRSIGIGKKTIIHLLIIRISPFPKRAAKQGNSWINTNGMTRCMDLCFQDQTKGFANRSARAQLVLK